MIRNLDAFERAIRLLIGMFALFAAWALFSNPFARLLAAAFGIFSVGECVMATCPLHAMLGMRKPGQLLPPDTLRLLGLLGVQVVLAYEWWSFGWAYVSDPGFINGTPVIIGSFASRNPFPAYREFLLGPALRNAQQFGYAVEWSQVAVSLALAGSAVAMLLVRREQHLRAALIVAICALAVGMLMNANFYVAAGWTGVIVRTINAVTFWVQAILLYAWASSLRAMTLSASADAPVSARTDMSRGTK